jgi:hypothetical protein
LVLCEWTLISLRLPPGKVESLALGRWVTSTDKSDSLDTELNSNLIVQATNHFRPVPKPLVLGAIGPFRPTAVLTVQGHCRNVGIDLGPDARPCSGNSVICRTAPLAS